MTQHSDIPRVNELYAEQQRVQSAIKLIDEGGVLASLSIAPPPAPPAQPYDPSKPSPPLMAMMMMAASVTNIGTVTPATMAAIRTQLVERDSEINAELVSLGITGSTTVS